MRFTEQFGLDEECMIQLKQQQPSVVAASGYQLRKSVGTPTDADAFTGSPWLTNHDTADLEFSLLGRDLAKGERCDCKLPPKARDRECPEPLPFLSEIGFLDAR